MLGFNHYIFLGRDRAGESMALLVDTGANRSRFIEEMLSGGRVLRELAGHF